MLLLQNILSEFNHEHNFLIFCFEGNYRLHSLDYPEKIEAILTRIKS